MAGTEPKRDLITYNKYYTGEETEKQVQLYSDSALHAVEKIYNELNSGDSVQKKVAVLNKLAEILFYQTKYDSSLQRLNQVVALSKQYGAQSLLAEAEMHIGNIWTTKQDYVKGMTHYVNAMKLAKNHSEKLQGNIAQKVSKLYILLGRYSEAMSYLDSAEANATKYKDDALLSLIYIGKGNVYVSKDYKDRILSDAYLNKALIIARNNRWSSIEQTALISLIRNEISEREYSSALTHLEIAKGVSTANWNGNIQILYFRGKSYLGLGELKKAKENLDEALALSKEKHNYYAPHILGLLSVLEEKKGNYRQSLDYYKQSALFKDSVGGDNIKDSVAWLKYQFQTAEKNNEITNNKLFIQHQKEIIYRKNYLTYTLIALLGLSCITAIVIFRYSRRNQKHKNEIMAWKAKAEGEELERARIATFLHDSIGATLSSASMWLKNAALKDRNIKENSDFNEGLKLLDLGLMGIRDGSHNLMPDLLERLGLAEAVAVYCSNIEETTDLKIEYQYYGAFSGIPEETNLIAYRTIQELVYNVIKHAKATLVIIQLSCHGKLLGITVEDNGVGFDTGNLNTATGIGLQNINNNAKYLNGLFTIHSEINGGTTIYIEYKV